MRERSTENGKRLNVCTTPSKLPAYTFVKMTNKKNFLYHGSIVAGIKELEPRKRYTPGVLGNNAKPAVYAAANPAYAAGHGFPWGSNDGFDIYENKGIVTLIVPKRHKKRLNQPVFIYKISGKYFKLLVNDSPKTRIYISYKKAKPVEVKSFKNVREAIRYYGGKIEII